MELRLQNLALHDEASVTSHLYLPRKITCIAGSHLEKTHPIVFRKNLIKVNEQLRILDSAFKELKKSDIEKKKVVYISHPCHAVVQGFRKISSLSRCRCMSRTGVATARKHLLYKHNYLFMAQYFIKSHDWRAKSLAAIFVTENHPLLFARRQSRLSILAFSENLGHRFVLSCLRMQEHRQWSSLCCEAVC